MVRERKAELINKAIEVSAKLKKANIQELREPLIIMKLNGVSYGNMAKFCKSEGMNVNEGQVRYHFKKYPLTKAEIDSIETEIYKSKNNK